MKSQLNYLVLSGLLVVVNGLLFLTERVERYAQKHASPA
jgi:hypothetical protein